MMDYLTVVCKSYFSSFINFNMLSTFLLKAKVLPFYFLFLANYINYESILVDNSVNIPIYLLPAIFVSSLENTGLLFSIPCYVRTHTCICFICFWMENFIVKLLLPTYLPCDQLFCYK